eukprot:25101-Pelagococcus_subviridis.AAC.2
MSVSKTDAFPLGYTPVYRQKGSSGPLQSHQAGIRAGKQPCPYLPPPTPHQGTVVLSRLVGGVLGLNGLSLVGFGLKDFVA